MPLEFSKLKTRSIHERAHKVAAPAVGRPVAKGCSFAEWFAAMPNFLGARSLRAIARAVVAARRAGRPVVFAYGGHVLKTGCSPLVVDLIERGVITSVATNGAGIIHDIELAEVGETSEDVGAAIKDGSFGMVRETFAWFNQIVARGKDIGLGRAAGELVEASGAPDKRLSILAAAHRANIPATAHVAIGTDTVHLQDALDGAALGAATLLDFRLLCDVVADMASPPGEAGGVWLNFGSAVILPEVFLKAVSVARNLGRNLDGMHSADCDMIRQYRPTENVVTRPVSPGHGHAVTGQHELLIPLLRQAVVEELGE